MGAEHQRVFVALVGGPFLALGDERGVGFQAQVVLVDLGRVVLKQFRREPPRQSRFTDSLRARQKQRLRDSLPPDHVAEGGGDGGVPKKSFQELTLPLPPHLCCEKRQNGKCQ